MSGAKAKSQLYIRVGLVGNVPIGIRALLLVFWVDMADSARRKKTTSNAPLRLLRCVQLLNMLQSRIGYSPSALAREFEVSKRTIYRDRRLLEEAGIPIWHEPHKGGYIVGCRLTPCSSRLSDKELTVLLLAAHIFSFSCGRETCRPLHQAISKLLAELPCDSRENVGNLLNSIRSSPACALWPRGSQAVIAKIFSAISRKRAVRIVYTLPGRTAVPLQTKVNPDYLMVSEKNWQLVGRSSWHRKVCHFNLEYIRDVQEIDDVRLSKVIRVNLNNRSALLKAS